MIQKAKKSLAAFRAWSNRCSGTATFPVPIGPGPFRNGAAAHACTGGYTKVIFSTMRLLVIAFIILIDSLFASFAEPPGLVPQVEKAALSGDFAGATKRLDRYRAAKGITPEYIEALSWVGRGELSRRQFDSATRNAADVRTLCAAQLAHRALDREPHLPLALGASIEVQALALAAQNRRDEAVMLLEGEMRRWRDTSIETRLRKNLNLLTLEGKPAPPLESTEWIGMYKPAPLAAHRGHPVLLFLWAHWCPDCKAEVPVIQKLMATYRSRGLELIAPTQRYGYVAGGKDAPAEVENRYIGEVFAKYYSALGVVEVPLSAEAFRRFGVSTTPTLVLVDSGGVVRLYHPGAMTYTALAQRVQSVLSSGSRSRT